MADRFELNPDHPVTRMVADNWYKLCAILVNRLGKDVVLSPEEISAVDNHAIVCEIKADETIHLQVVTMEEAIKLAKKEELKRQRKKSLILTDDHDA